MKRALHEISGAPPQQPDTVSGRGAVAADSPPGLSRSTGAPPPPQPTRPRPRVKVINRWQRIGLWGLRCAVRVWLGTLRFSASREDECVLLNLKDPFAFALWHNRLLIAAEVFRRYRGTRKLYALVSPSGDGAWLSALFEMIGMHTVRGSSHKFGREAVSALVDVLRAGGDIGITPDGPRGPSYVFKPGALVVTRRAQASIVLLGAAFESAWRLRSWDRFILPKPFSKVWLRTRLIPADSLPTNRDEAAKFLEGILREISPDLDEAEAGPSRRV